MNYGIQKYKWRPNGMFVRDTWALWFGLENSLSEIDGMKVDHRPWKGFYFSLRLNPLRWGWGPEHIYYDGENCIWTYGPFGFARFGYVCKECYDSDREMV
jgi:hypothetical protein